MQTLDPVLAPPRTFTLPKAPAGDSAAARHLSRSLHDTAETVTSAQQEAHQVLERARQFWGGPSASASHHPLDALDLQTRTVAHQLRQAATALEDYAHRLDKAHEQHHWSWTRVLKVAAVVAVTTTAVVVTVGAAAPAAAAADAALVTGEVAATATAVTAATASAVEATEAVATAVRALRNLRAVATFLRPQVAVTAGLTDLEAFRQVRRTGDLDVDALTRHAGTSVVFGSVGGTLAGAVGSFGAEVSEPLLAYLLPKAAQASAWAGTTAGEELLVDGHVDGLSVATSASVSLGGAVLADGLARWMPATAATDRAVNRAVDLHPNAPDPRWGLTPAHLKKHFEEGPLALRQLDPGGSMSVWLEHLETLFRLPPTTVRSDGVVEVSALFPRVDGQGFFRLGARLFRTGADTFDLITVLTRQTDLHG